MRSLCSMRTAAASAAFALSAALTLAAGGAPKSAAPPEKLTEAGETLRAGYAEMLASLRKEIAQALPKIDEKKQVAVRTARAELKAAEAELAKAQQGASKIQAAQGLVEHAKGKWIGGAEKGIAKARDTLAKAKTDAERTAALAEIAKWEANKAEGQKALVERQAALEAAKADEEKLNRAKRTAQEAVERARAADIAASKALSAELGSFLDEGKLDGKLVKAAVLAEATPQGLAAFAQRGAAQKDLVDKLLADVPLMTEMLVADGAAGGKYGEAMQIYANIQAASPKASKGILQRVALATALAHAVPIGQRNSEAEQTASTTVDPVKRYLHYEKAYLAGELDPAFPTLTTWECRYVVDSYAPDEMLAWAREMLRNYRPDHITNANYGWRYSGAVRTDVAYRHSNEYQDLDSLNFFQNICKNGGICGRRAFFGRYVVQAFGLPARPFTQPKHAAIVRWTPAGWVVNLGAGWPSGWFVEQTGPEFLLETQARRFPREHQKVLRAEWIGLALGESKVVKKNQPLGPWMQMAAFEKQAIIADKKPAELAALGSDIAEANESAEAKAAAVEKAAVTESDKKISKAADGSITIPAGALGGGNHVIKSYGGGLQMICGDKPITCTVDVPQAGKYALSARVVTVHGEQTLTLTPSDPKAKVEVSLPFTVGAWQKSTPVEVSLAAGKNVLNFSKPSQTFALKELTLTPVK